MNLLTLPRGQHGEMDNDPSRRLDRVLGALLARLDGGAVPTIGPVTALLSQRRQEGHVCLDLRDASSATLLPAGFSLEELRKSRLVGAPGEFKPLILDGADRLYLHQLYQDECALARAILQRAAQPPCTLEAEAFRAACEFHLGARSPGPDGMDRTRIAAYLALTRTLALVTGGPGTGKTWLAGRILGMGISLGVFAPHRVALAAPTGKAAARLDEMIRPNLDDAARAQLPGARTLHRLLGVSADGRRTRHHARFPLDCDVLVVDETSMADQRMLSLLFDACPPHARILLLGDPGQLAPVEAGSILADLAACSRDYPNDVQGHIEAATGESLPPADDKGPLADCRVHLNVNHRFRECPGLSELAAGIREGRSGDVRGKLGEGSLTGVTWEPKPLTAAGIAAILAPFQEAFGRACAAETPAKAHAELSRAKILCALRQGPWGAPAINERLEARLRSAGLAEAGDWYRGRPVMVTRNDYALGLFNGDLGVAWPDDEGRRCVWFAGADAKGAMRAFDPSRLPAHETAYALTIHKSQGSEFDEVLVLLPEGADSMMTREMAYTAVTRARRKVTLVASAELLAAAIETPTRRAGGLAEALRRA